MSVPETADRKLYSASELSRRFDLRLVGDDHAMVDGVCSVVPGRPYGLAFVDNVKRLTALSQTQASIVIAPAPLDHVDSPAILVSSTPRLAFARVAALFEADRPLPGVAASAVVDERAMVSDSATLAANVVIGAAHVGASVVIGAGTFVGDDVEVGDHSVIGPNVTLLPGTRLGQRVRVGAGAVIGERGFGLVPGPEGLEPIPQLGGVCVGDDVEIGANTTVDRGAIDDTVLEAGVKLDNQVHVAHNCKIGAQTVIAGCTGIAGSCTIGKRCMIAGGVGIGDHVTIVDDVTITAASQVPKSIDSAGVYSSTFRAMPARHWRRRLALFRALDRLEARLSKIETKSGVIGDKDG